MLDRLSNYLQVSISELRNTASVHRLALITFPLLAALFLNDVLFSNKSLSAFDIQLSQTSFNTEFSFKGVHDPVLSDSPYAHYPERKLNWELFRQRNNFDFSPYIFTGSNYTGKKIGAFITSLPQLVLDTPNAMDWSIWFRMTLAGFFMYLLLVSLGINRAGAILAGVLWTYNLHQIVWLEFPQHLAAQLWMPLLLLLNIQLIKCKDALPINLILGLILANLLFNTSGYTQIVLYFYFFIGLFNTLYIGFDQSSSLKQRLKKWILVNGVYIVATSILIADLLSELYGINTGLRGSQGFRARDPELVLAFSTLFDFIKNAIPGFNELWRFFSADYLGGIWGKEYNREISGNIIEGGTYFGVVGLFLSFYSLTGHRLLKDKRLFYVLLFLFFFLVAFNNGDTLVMSIYNLIPFGGAGTYSRMLTIIIFLLCIFAAYGLSHLLRDITEKNYKKIALAFALFCFLPVLARLLDSEFFIREFLYAYIVLAISFTIFVLILRTKHKALIPYVIILISIIDLFAVSYDFNTRMRNSRIFPENKTIQYLLSDRDTFRVAVFANTPIYHPNILTYYSLPTIGGYLTVASTDYINFIRKAYGEVRVTLNGIMYLFKGGNLDVLRQLNVKYIISDEKLETDKAELAHFNNNNYIYRLLDPLPRAYCGSDLIKTSHEKTIDDFVAALERFDRPVVSTDLPLSPGPLPDDCSVVNLKTYVNKIEFQANTSIDSVVIIPYSHNKFWRATVNDEMAKIYRVNNQLMAVIVPAGNSRIEILYQNTYEVVSSSMKIVFALAAIGIILFWSSPGLISLTLILVFSTMVWKNSYTLPGIKNNDIPERAERRDIVVPDTTGTQRTGGGKKSKPVFATNAFKSQFVSPLNGLRKIALHTTNSSSSENDYDIRVIVRDSESGLTSQQLISSREFEGDRWLDVSLNEFENSRNRVFEIEIHADKAKKSDSLMVFMDNDDKLSLITYHNPVTAYQ